MESRAGIQAVAVEDRFGGLGDESRYPNPICFSLLVHSIFCARPLAFESAGPLTRLRTCSPPSQWALYRCHHTGEKTSMKDHFHGRLRRDSFSPVGLLVVNAIVAVLAGLRSGAIQDKMVGHHRVRPQALDEYPLFGRLDAANLADSIEDGRNALSAYLSPSCPSCCC